MEPIIEITAGNIYTNNKYSSELKNEFIMTINKIITFEKIIDQSIRSMNYVLAYNYLYDMIIFLDKQLIYFKIYLENDVMEIVEDYINVQIDKYNNLMLKL